jgi:hypothetical protein
VFARVTLALVHVNFAVVPCVPWLAATPVGVDSRGRARSMVLAWLAQTLVDILVAVVAIPSQCTYALDWAGARTQVRRFLSAIVALVLMGKRLGTLLATPVLVSLSD